VTIRVGDLVTISVCADIGVVLSIKEMIVNEFDLHQDVTLLAVVYWQNSARSRLELLKDLSKIN
jgi:hypothetical protein